MRGRKKEYKLCDVCGIGSDEKIITKTSVNGEVRTLCSKHYQLLRNYGREYSKHDLKKERNCDICGIKNSESQIMTTNKFGEKMNLCRIHYGQLTDSGKISNRKENKYIEHENYYEIILHTKDGKENGSALFSKEHLEEVKKHKWWKVNPRSGNSSYVYGKSENSKQITLHSLICKLLYGEPPKGMTPDHLNRDGLDNRKENLMYKDASDQMVNQGVCKRNTSGVKGVSTYKNKWWRARLMYKGKELVEIFNTFNEAVNKRKEWEEIRDKGEWML